MINPDPFVITIKDDTLTEPSTKVFAVRLKNAGSGSSLDVRNCGQYQRAEISITDDGDVEYGFAQPSYTVVEGNSVAVTVSKSANTAAAATIAYSVSSASLGYAPSSAYQPITGTLVFSANEMSKSFTVQTIDNTVYSEDQAIPLQLSVVSSSGAGSVSLSSMTRTTLVTIQDDGDAGRIEIGQIT